MTENKALAELQREAQRQVQEVFTHDYVATTNFFLQRGQVASIELRVNDKTYPLVTLATHDSDVLIDKVHVHGWHKRTIETAKTAPDGDVATTPASGSAAVAS
jgi:hypothetical protein